MHHWDYASMTCDWSLSDLYFYKTAKKIVSVLGASLRLCFDDLRLRWLATSMTCDWSLSDLYFYKIARVVLIHIQVLESLTRKLWQKEPTRTEEIAEIDDKLEFQFRWVREVCCQFTKREIDKNVAQLVKNLPAMWETWIWPLGWEDPLEKGMATHSSILACRSPWTIYSP